MESNAPRYLPALFTGRMPLVLIAGLLLSAPIGAQTKTDRDSAGLKGPVRSVRTEQTELAQDGQTIRRPRHLQSVATYDERGNLIEELSYRPDGALRVKKTTSWDGAGHKIITTYNADGKMSGRSVYTFDAAGHVTEWSYYDATGALKNKAVNTYDGQGQFTGGEVYDAAGALESRTVVTFDEQKKQPVTAIYDEHGTLLDRNTLTARGGDVIRYKPDGTVWVKETRAAARREFDARGNWIKQTWPKSSTRDDKTEDTIEVLYREITYY